MLFAYMSPVIIFKKYNCYAALCPWERRPLMKKLILTALLLGFVLAAAGCGSSNDANVNLPPEKVDALPVQAHRPGF